MTSLRKLTGSRGSRAVWGALALLAAALLMLTLPLGSRALENEEASARANAVEYTNTVLFDALTQQDVERGIPRTDYQKLIVTVQGKILSDQAVARVRVWAPDGTLIFSSDQRDKVGVFVASDDPQIQEAAQGDTVSLMTATRVAPKTGLAGSNETLYETFVPLRLEGEVGVSAVTQIDHRYAAIQRAAYTLWRPAQYALGAAALLFLILFWFSLRAAPTRFGRGRGGRQAGADDYSGRVRAAEAAARLAKDASREAEERAVAAERSSKDLQQRLAASEQRLREALVAAGAAGGDRGSASRIAELEAEIKRLRQTASEGSRAPVTIAATAQAEFGDLKEQLRDSEELRERMAGEVQRLKAALAAKDADLALAQAGSVTGAAEASRTEERVHTAEERARAADERAAHVEARALEAEQRGLEAEQRALEAERRVAEAEQRALGAERRVAETEARAGDAAATLAAVQAEAAQEREATEQRAEAEIRKTQLDLEKMMLKLTETESLLAESTKRSGALEAAASQAEGARGAIADELERTHASLAEERAELARLRAAFAAREAELAAAGSTAEELARTRASLAEEQAELARLQAAFADREAELAAAGAAGDERAHAAEVAAAERVRAAEARTEEAERKVAEIEDRLASAVAAVEQVPSGADQEARVRELEVQRGRDVEELTRVQAQLANTQVELTQATRRAKEAEQRLRELEQEGSSAPAPEPSLAPEPEPVPEGGEPASESALARLRRRREPAPTEEPAEVDEGGLSLRERLARAAAARHRVGGSAGGSESDET